MTDPWQAQREALGAFIRAQRKMANLSLRQLAQLTSLSNPYLSQVERGLHQPSVRVLRQISDALNLSAETLLAEAGLIDAMARDRTRKAGSDKVGAPDGIGAVGTTGTGVAAGTGGAGANGAGNSGGGAGAGNSGGGAGAGNPGGGAGAGNPEGGASAGEPGGGASAAEADARADVADVADAATAGAADAVAAPPDTEEAIRADDRLTEDQKAALIAVYRSMLR
ncbi:MAG: helix-turn-helix transcriptional regulator [Streptosporangiaceae bacterium]|nr:helix-turn-helix transcriptional regulator [Streptosporangiaceae bacterium]MBV9857499.1 helix-turn-helix transcriptional regulator [Streptosporangiaceae bacterium]